MYTSQMFDLAGLTYHYRDELFLAICINLQLERLTQHGFVFKKDLS